VTWLRLSEAAVLIDHDVQKARERLEQAIKKAWLVRPPGLPQPTLDPNVPLRIQLTSLAGLRIEGRAWLDDPVLHWEASEIECLCRPWMPSSRALSSAVATQSRVKIEVWDDDLVRLWGNDNSTSQAAANSGGLIATPCLNKPENDDPAVLDRTGDPFKAWAPLGSEDGA
jgi:hypothetical protein